MTNVTYLYDICHFKRSAGSDRPTQADALSNADPQTDPTPRYGRGFDFQSKKISMGEKRNLYLG